MDFGDKVLLDYPLSEIHDYVLSDVDCTKYLFDHYYPQIEYTAELLGVPLEAYVNAPNSYITKILQGRKLYEQNIITKATILKLFVCMFSYFLNFKCNCGFY